MAQKTNSVNRARGLGGESVKRGGGGGMRDRESRRSIEQGRLSVEVSEKRKNPFLKKLKLKTGLCGRVRKRSAFYFMYHDK